MTEVAHEGGCHCGAVRYRFEGPIHYNALCHCEDCRRTSGAPVVSWCLIETDQLQVTGLTRSYASSPQARRSFCPKCGTSLFYTNPTLFPGQTDVQSATLDNPNALPLDCQVQVAERISWMVGLDDLPAFERYPPKPTG